MGAKIRNSGSLDPVNWILVFFCLVLIWYLFAMFVAERTCKDACDAVGYEKSQAADMAFWWFSTSKCECSDPVLIDLRSKDE